jgi:hypothetical protein
MYNMLTKSTQKQLHDAKEIIDELRNRDGVFEGQDVRYNNHSQG